MPVQKIEKIELPLYRCRPLIPKDLNSHYYMTYLNGIIINPFNNKKDQIIKRFLLDTGSSISILNRTYVKFFKDTKKINETAIQYGSGKRTLPVYNVILKIKGIEFKMCAALDSNLSSPSLLGHYTFLNNIQHLGLSKKRRKLTIIK